MMLIVLAGMFFCIGYEWGRREERQLIDQTDYERDYGAFDGFGISI